MIKTRSTQSLWSLLDTIYTQESAVAEDVASNADVTPPQFTVNFEDFHNTWRLFYHDNRHIVHWTDEDQINAQAEQYNIRLIDLQKQLNNYLKEKGRTPTAPNVVQIQTTDTLSDIKMLGIGALIGVGVMIGIKVLVK
jgi:hypothetical protein